MSACVFVNDDFGRVGAVVSLSETDETGIGMN